MRDQKSKTSLVTKWFYCLFVLLVFSVQRVNSREEQFGVALDNFEGQVREDNMRYQR